MLRWERYVSLAWMIAICAFLPAQGKALSEVRPVGLLPDSGGAITEAVISVNSARRATLRNAQLISNIVNAFPKRVKFHIFTNDPTAFTVAANPWPERIHFHHLPADNPITIWTQDPFIVMKETDQATSLLAPREFLRADDRVMAAELARLNGYQLHNSELVFEGGNIVSDYDYVLIGANTVRRNAIELEMEEEAVVRRLQDSFGRPVLVIGPVPQPVAHIDMILTPLGGREIVVADARSGIGIAEQALKNAPLTVEAFEKQCEDYFFGDPSIRKITTKGGEVISAPPVVGQTPRMIELSRNIAPLLDGIASSLESFGYQVHRMPFLFGGPESNLPDIDPTALQATYPMLTYNNVIIETDNGQRLVYLPGYGWPALDHAAEEQWRGLGYQVHKVDGLTTSAMYGGSLRCAVKVLARERP